MLPDDPREIEQLDVLAAELTEAGRVARVALAARETPDPVFATRLRLQLLGPAGRTADGVAAVAPTGPLETPLVDRRSVDRPFTDTRSAAAPSGAIDGAEAEPDAGKRWSRAGVHHAAAGRSVILPPTEPLDGDAEQDHLAALRPAMQWRLPTRILPARWVAVGLAASLVVASFLYGTTLMFPTRPYAIADVASHATVVRDGVSAPLAQGEELHEGDEIRVADGGEATLSMGGSFARMASGSTVRLVGLAPSAIELNQVAGRVYHRAVVGPQGKYQVVTASVDWRSVGTAFDLDRHATAGGEEVRGMALLDGLNLSGPELQAAVNQGESALVQLGAQGSPIGQPVVASIGSSIQSDKWLLENARLDNLQGLNLGELAALLSPTPRPSQSPVTLRTATPEPTTATTAPTAAPTAAPTRKPTPKPTRTGPAPLGKLSIVKNKDGSYKFSWPKYTGAGFQYYKLVYGPAGTQPTFKGSNYWACNETVDNTTWTGSIDIGNYAVRLQVVDETGGKVVIRAQTNIVTLKVAAPTPTMPATQNLGGLSVSDDGGGKYTFSWAPYTGGWDFDAYKLVYVAWDGSPSYTSGADYWAAIGPGGTTTGSIGVPSGDWSVRVQAVGWPFGDAYVFGQSTVYHLTVP